jgi:tRNA threonylcarbamoyladenosine biosynthesis protein TsaE
VTRQIVASIFEINCPSELATHELAAAFASQLRPGDVVAMDGPLGAGKTRFVRGVAAALHADPSFVNSPTFGLIQHYDGDPPLIHLDAYRLSGEEEFERMGGAELFEPDAVTLIEWSLRIAGSLPVPRWVISASHRSETSRVYGILRMGPDATARMRDLNRALDCLCQSKGS